MASGVVGKVDSPLLSGAKRGGERGFWILASLVLDYLLGVMVGVAQFVSEGCRVGLRGVSAMLLFDVGIWASC